MPPGVASLPRCGRPSGMTLGARRRLLRRMSDFLDEIFTLLACPDPPQVRGCAMTPAASSTITGPPLELVRRGWDGTPRGDDRRRGRVRGKRTDPAAGGEGCTT